MSNDTTSSPAACAAALPSADAQDAEVVGLQAEIAKLKEQLEEAQDVTYVDALDKRLTDAADTEAKLKKIKEQFEALQAQQKQTQRELADAERALADTEDQLADAEDQLADTERELEKARSASVSAAASVADPEDTADAPVATDEAEYSVESLCAGLSVHMRLGDTELVAANDRGEHPGRDPRESYRVDMKALAGMEHSAVTTGLLERSTDGSGFTPADVRALLGLEFGKVMAALVTVANTMATPETLFTAIGQHGTIPLYPMRRDRATGKPARIPDHQVILRLREYIQALRTFMEYTKDALSGLESSPEIDAAIAIVDTSYGKIKWQKGCKEECGLLTNALDSLCPPSGRQRRAGPPQWQRAQHRPPNVNDTHQFPGLPTVVPVQQRRPTTPTGQPTRPRPPVAPVQRQRRQQHFAPHAGQVAGPQRFNGAPPQQQYAPPRQPMRPPHPYGGGVAAPPQMQFQNPGYVQRGQPMARNFNGRGGNHDYNTRGRGGYHQPPAGHFNQQPMRPPPPPGPPRGQLVWDGYNWIFRQDI